MYVVADKGNTEVKHKYLKFAFEVGCLNKCIFTLYHWFSFKRASLGF